VAHILFVEDDVQIRGRVAEFLEQSGFRVSVALDGGEMDRLLGDDPVDLLILDAMLPTEDGLSLCRRVRAAGGLPVIMLSARASESDRVSGLEAGADDFLAKPFGNGELAARIRSVLRRCQNAAPTPTREPSAVLMFKGWRLDLTARRLHTPHGVCVPLTVGEYELLVTLCEHPKRVLTREELLQLTRSKTSPVFQRSVDLRVSRLRQRIEEDPRNPQLIQTIRSGGYVFTPDVTTA
jgi:two-component system, OmpR family, response regulator